MTNQRKCEHCGGPIPDHARPDAKYCKTSCRVMAHQAARRDQTAIKIDALARENEALRAQLGAGPIDATKIAELEAEVERLRNIIPALALLNITEDEMDMALFIEANGIDELKAATKEATLIAREGRRFLFEDIIFTAHEIAHLGQDEQVGRKGEPIGQVQGCKGQKRKTAKFGSR
jgi:hypothetical protein